MRGEIHLHSPNTPSWRGAQLKKQSDNFTFVFTLQVFRISLLRGVVALFSFLYCLDIKIVFTCCGKADFLKEMSNVSSHDSFHSQNMMFIFVSATELGGAEKILEYR
jgi:hypothetical protein